MSQWNAFSMGRHPILGVDSSICLLNFDVLTQIFRHLVELFDETEDHFVGTGFDASDDEYYDSDDPLL
jgi:hypothetical protein